MHGQATTGRFWACLMIAWAAAGAAPVTAAHILIDASKDGGRWWCPQGAGQRFDPAAPPPAWIPLAWLGGTTWTQPAVAGYLRHGRGDVVVVGCALESFFRGEALADLVEALTSQAPEVLSAALGQAQTVGLLRVGAPQAPTPVSPAEGEELARPQSAQDTWVFAWQPVTGATRYHFAAIGPTATTPAVFGLAATTAYACPVAALPASPRSQHGWVWQVRAQNVATQWSDWSDPRSFSIPGGVPRAAAQRAPPAASPEPAAETKTAAVTPASDTPKARATATLRLGVTIGGLALLVLLGLILIKSMSRP